MYRLLPDSLGMAVSSQNPRGSAALDAVDAVSDEPWSRLTFVMGGPRSGTTWLAKIFDSHPDVLYRHEPDTILRNPSLPRFPEPADLDEQCEAARAWVEQLIDVKALKAAGSLPGFRKSYLPAPAWVARQASGVALRLLEQMPGQAQAMTRRIGLPDFVDWRRRPDIHLVLKSVSARGRVGLLARALPGSSVVFILRHPCGNVGSELRGDERGLFEQRWDPVEVLRNPLAASYGLTEESFLALPRLEQRAWNWVLSNEVALQALETLPRVRVLRYRDLCAQPMEIARALFTFAGLDWHPQTEAFIRRSTTHAGPSRYYSVYRNTPSESERWRREMPAEEQRRIMAVVRHSPLAALYPEPEIG